MASCIDLDPAAIFLLHKSFDPEDCPTGRICKDFFHSSKNFLHRHLTFHHIHRVKTVFFCKIHFLIIFLHITALLKLCKILICERQTAFSDNFLIQSATAAYLFQCSVQMCDRCLDFFLRCLFCSAQHNRTRMCRLRSQQILRHVRKFRLQLCVDYGNDISDLIPPIQWFIPQHIKEFIHIVYTGWFHQYPIIPAHSHRDQLRAKSPPVCFPVASTGDHLQLALIPHQFLQ